MSSGGPSSPTTVVNDASYGGKAWTTPDNARKSDNVYTTIGSYSGNSNYLKATGFQFTICEEAIIDGILVEIERKENDYNGPTVDNVVKIVKADGSLGTENKADTVTEWPLADTYKSYGGEDDLWSEEWTPADINDIDFGVVLAVNTPAGIGLDAYVDHIRITVYYHVPAAGGGERAVAYVS